MTTTVGTRTRASQWRKWFDQDQDSDSSGGQAEPSSVAGSLPSGARAFSGHRGIEFMFINDGDNNDTLTLKLHAIHQIGDPKQREAGAAVVPVYVALDFLTFTGITFSDLVGDSGGYIGSGHRFADSIVAVTDGLYFSSIEAVYGFSVEKYAGTADDEPSIVIVQDYGNIPYFAWSWAGSQDAGNFNVLFREVT